MKIPVFVANLKKRLDRRGHIEKQFADKSEFYLNIITAHEHQIGAIGLWHTLRDILSIASSENFDFFIFCEDDHVFEKNYNEKLLVNAIKEAKNLNADILLGGVSWVENSLKMSDLLVWVDKFSGTQFAIVFKKFYKTLWSCDFTERDAIDFKISALTMKKFVIFPFISTQKDFGYSDASAGLSGFGGVVSETFIRSSNRISESISVDNYYNKRNVHNYVRKSFIESVTIPTYVIMTQKDDNFFLRTLKQFDKRKEFHIRKDISKSDNNDILYQIKNCLKDSIEKDDDLVILCTDKHKFTIHYERYLLIKNLISANKHGIEILFGGIGNFSGAVPINKSLYWIFSAENFHFAIFYKKAIKALYKSISKGKNISMKTLCDISIYKAVIFPFISWPQSVSKSRTKEVNEEHLFFHSEMSIKDIRDALGNRE